MEAVTLEALDQQQHVEQQKRQQQQQQQRQQAPAVQPKGPQPSVDRVRSLLYRRLKVVLPSGRIIEGDLACLDKQGNLILSNACEHILTAAANSSSESSKGSTAGSKSNSSTAPQTTQLGMVLVPKAQQQQVSLKVTLSEKASMLSLTGNS